MIASVTKMNYNTGDYKFAGHGISSAYPPSDIGVSKLMSDYITIELSKTGKHKDKYVAIVDSVDADLAQYDWRVQMSTNKYAVRSVKTKNVYLHRVIMERMLDGNPIPNNIQVDHISGDSLDCRRGNLRLATRSQNMHNSRRRKNNTSGYKGVAPHKISGKWIASFCVNYKYIYLGYFDTPELAYEAVCKAREDYHKEYANQGDSQLAPLPPKKQRRVADDNEGESVDDNE